MPRPYPREFREGALALVREGERPIAQIALELGIAESCLRRWVKQAELDGGERDHGLTTGDRLPLGRRRINIRGEVSTSGEAADCAPSLVKRRKQLVCHGC